MYQGTWESVRTHPLPDWYSDAKLGVFLHWGLFSVPGWAPQVDDVQAVLRQQGPKGLLRNNPYAEWYRNSMQIEGSPTWAHHRETWGVDFPYDGFIERFNDGTAGCDVDAIARVCEEAGAGYVVLTTKHHEGFTLWPASIPHPKKGAYHANRDLVGDLTEAVRARGMRMGLYYSGGYDWPWNDIVMRAAADTVLAVPADPDYERYATAHVRELIDRYQPDVLWNDICWPSGGNLAELFAYYYNRVPEGVVNDRWLQSSHARGPLGDALIRGVGGLVQMLWKHLPDDRKELTFPTAEHCDFNTPEYTSFDTVREKKWEATRGVGHSFGADRNERPEDIVTATDLVRSFCDIISKNGNLLIGIGPDDNGVIPSEQVRPLQGLGEWMSVNGEAVSGTRPWAFAAVETTEGTPVRFTRRGTTVYAILLDLPGRRDFGLRGIDLSQVSDPVMLGIDERLGLASHDDGLRLTLPERVPLQAAYAIRLGDGVRPLT
ncbi:MAG: alpha-L-fucosidase [Actinobacteria bacterium]|nr:alpha-L-fucosidase [Actinomycetota bacterium]